MRGLRHQVEHDGWNMQLVGHTDFGGEGDCMHIGLKDGVAFVGHQTGGTSIVDVRDPRSPRRLGYMGVPDNTHSHKVQVLGDVLLVNRERRFGGRGKSQSWLAGLSVYDITNPFEPTEIAFWPCGDRGVHRMTYWEEPYAYVTAGSPDVEGQFLIVLDLSDPSAPIEAGRWWLPGMRHDEISERDWPDGREVLLHHGIPRGDRLYTGWWDMGLVILDISDVADPSLVSVLDLETVDGPSRCTHTACPLPNRDVLIVTDECVEAPARIEYQVRLIDISDDTDPRIISRLPIPEGDFKSRGGRFGPHNVHEYRPGSFQSEDLVFLTYFNAGVRVYDVSDAENPKEVAYFVPKAPAGKSSIQMNDIFVDADGLIYATDREGGGLYIMEMS